MLKSITNVSFVLLFVKIIGFIKQATIAAFFGAGGATDIYLLVSELIESLGEVLFSSISVAFLTIYTDISINQTKEKRDRFVSNTLLFGSPFVVLISGVIFVFSYDLAALFAPGYENSQLLVTSRYIKILSTTLVLMFSSSVLRAILDAEKVFIPSKLEGVIKSFITIGACVLLSSMYGVEILIWCICIYYIVTNIYLSVCVYKKAKIRLYVPQKDTQVKHLLVVSLPLFISNGSVYLHSIIDKAIGSTLEEGAISVLSYSGYLINTIHSLVIGSVCAVVFSYFSTYVAQGKNDELSLVLEKSTRILSLLMIYISLMVCLCSYEIVKIVYGRGAFNSEDISTTAGILFIYSIGLFFIAIRDLLIRVHYSYQDTKTTMINGLIGMTINVAFSIVLSTYLGSYGIAMATVLANFVMMILMFITVRRHIIFDVNKRVVPLIICLLVICMFIGVITFAVDSILLNCGAIINLLFKGIVGTTLYILCLFLIKNKEMKEAVNFVKEKFINEK